MTAVCSLSLIQRFILIDEPTIQFYEERLDQSQVFTLVESIQTISFAIIDKVNGQSVKLDPRAGRLFAYSVSPATDNNIDYNSGLDNLKSCAVPELVNQYGI